MSCDLVTEVNKKLSRRLVMGWKRNWVLRLVYLAVLRSAAVSAADSTLLAAASR